VKSTITKLAWTLAGSAAVVYGLLAAEVLFVIAGAALLLREVLRLGFHRSGTRWPATSDQPRRLEVGWLDYVKMLVSWVLAFERTYVIEPGLYQLGPRYDPGAPLLVTANYHMSVVLVARHARQAGARLLVVDTDGINVWCSAGKGAFSNAAILAQLQRYDRELLTDGKWLRLVVPKLALSGVDLRALREHGIRPVIGPLYAKDLPAYLAQPKLEDRDDDRVVFGLQSRLFTWLPGLVQYVGYAAVIVMVLMLLGLVWEVSAPLGLILVVAALGTAYPVLFPWLPGRRFAIKGIVLGTLGSLALGLLVVTKALDPLTLAFAIPFTFAASIFIGLSYTGNSAVSNYTRVRRETAQFLPVNVLLFVASLVVFLSVGGPT
jgi:acetyl-CoA decarbonylase/synthase complex subunit gamma